jgi:Spy/CpxP family protein refolding chaperone
MYRSTAVLFCLVLLAVTWPAHGQQADPIAENLYSPELLVRHADEVGLDAAQKQFIVSQARVNRQKYVELHRNLQNEMAALSGIVGQDHPQEQAALDQLDKVLAAEREIKRMQLSLALSIRGKLTPEQQAKARELRQKYASEMQRPASSCRISLRR